MPLVETRESFAAGEIVGMLGPNGAGKTTAMRIMTLALHPQKGEVWWQGVPLLTASERDRVSYRKSYGYLPESISLHMKLTGWEYACFFGELYDLPKKDTEQRIANLFEQFDLTEAKDRYVTTYSQGMLKKFALVCSVLHSPRILFLDEPTNGLDPLAIMVLEEFLGRLAAEGVAVVVASHNLHFIDKVCHRILFVHKGSVKHRTTAGGDLRSTDSLGELEALYREIGLR